MKPTRSPLIVLALGLVSTQAFAAADTFALGDGHNGPLTVLNDAGTVLLGRCAPVSALDGGSELSFGAGQVGQFGFSSGGLVLLVRSTGLASAASGDQSTVDLTANSVGTIELARIANVTIAPDGGVGSMSFTSPLLNAAAFATDTQVVTVPEYTNVTVDSPSSLSAPAWNGSCGGVVALLANGTVTLNGAAATITATAAGFRGGVYVNQPNGSLGCVSFDGDGGARELENARKGEGLVPTRFGVGNIGYGNVANGAGGGNCHNAGGGGGGHGGRGGVGGFTWSGDGSRPVGGLGGAAVTYPMLSKLVFGGGGGAGSSNNGNGSGGGAGGGFVFVRANALAGNGVVRANGQPGPNAPANDAAGGGGAGGSISLRLAGAAACVVTVEARGGNGGSVNASQHGPGGGGAGGRILFQTGADAGCPLTVVSGVGGTESGGSTFGTGPDAGTDATTLGNVSTLPGPLTPPVVAFTAPLNGGYANTNPAAFTGTATPSSSVSVVVGGSVLCTAAVSLAGTWACTPVSTMAEGSTTASATSTFQALVSSPAGTTFTLDSVAPAITLSTPTANQLFNTTTITFSGTAEPGAAVRVVTDNSREICAVVAAPVTGAFSCTATVSEGVHTVHATGTDAALNSASTPERTFTVDTTPPAVAINVPAANAHLNTVTPTFSGTAEAGAAISVAVDGSVVCTTVATGGVWSCSPAMSLTETTHTVVVTATDAATNSASTPPRGFTIDVTPPGPPVITSPTQNQFVTTTTPTFSGTAEVGSVVSVVVNSGAADVLVCTAVTDSMGAWSCVAGSALSQGQHDAVATATDAASNSSTPSTPARRFIIDSIAPTAPVLTVPTSGTLTADSTPTFSGTADPATTVIVRVDGNAVCTTTADVSGVFSCTPTSPIADGAHTATATATDAATNVSLPSAAVPFTIDATAPNPPVLVALANGTVTRENLPTFTGTAEAGSTVTVRVDGAIVCTAVATGGSFSCAATSALPEGQHTAQATATDAALNVSQGSNVNGFVIDRTAPFTPSVLVPSSGATTGESPVFSGLSEPGSTVTASVDGNVSCTAVANAQGGWACTPSTPLSVGAHSVSAQAVDPAGNTSPVSTAVAFTVAAAQAPAAPVLTQPTNGSTTRDTTPAFSGIAVPQSTVKISVDGTVVCTVTADASGAFSCDAGMPLSEGARTATATATVGLLSSASSSPVQFTIDITAPSAPTITAPAANATTGPSPTFEGLAEAGSTVSVTVDGNVVCSSVANAQGAWACTVTSALAVGAHTATAAAADPAGNVSAASAPTDFTVAAGVAPSAPVIAEPTAGQVTNDSTPNVSGRGAPGSTVAVSIDGMVACTATVNAQGQWACTPAPALGDGDHVVTAKATDANGTSPDSVGVNFAVDTAAPAAPVVTSPAANATVSPSPTLAGSAEANSTVTVRVDGVVVCLVTASSTGAWSCVVGTTLVTGMHAVTATATDKGGNVSAESPAVNFTVAVGTAPGVPTLTSPSNGSTSSDNTPTYSGMAAPGATVTIKVDGIAVCTTTASSQGAWSCTQTTPLADGAHSATASASNVFGSSAETAAIQFSVDATAPNAPVISAPAPGSTSTTATPTFGGTAEPGSTVEVKVDGATLCTAVADGAGAWACAATTPLSNGSHTVSATAKDAAGNTSPSSVAQTFTVDTSITVAAPVINSPANDTVFTSSAVTLSGTAVANSTVTVRDGTTTVCTATASAQGAWSCEATFEPGDHSVTATATVGANTSAPSNTVRFKVASTTTIKRPGQRLVGGGCGCGAGADGTVAVLGVFVMFALTTRRRRRLSGNPLDLVTIKSKRS